MKKINQLLIIGGAIIAAFFLLKKKTPGSESSKFQTYTTTGNISKTAEQINQIAKAQFDAMTVIGTKKRVFESLNGLSGDELRAVYNAFGIKKYLGASGSGFIAEWFGSELDLFGWYTEELGISDLPKMRQLWKSKSVNVTF